MTGKQEKMDPEAKKKMRQERLEERFEYERLQLRAGEKNGYEMIFPSPYNEELNVQYENFIKKANDIWDEFTTGKAKKKPVEPIEIHKKKVVEKKKQNGKKEGQQSVANKDRD